MVEFTPEIIESIKVVGSKIPDIKSRLEGIYNQPYMAQFSDDIDRQNAAAKILTAQIMAQTDKAAYSKAETITMRIEGKEEVMEFKRHDGIQSYRSNLFVTAIRDGDAKFGRVTLWGDANEMNPRLIIGKTYLIPAVINIESPLNISINDVVDFDTSDENIPPLSDVITSDLVPIAINDMENNISKDWNDLKLVKGTVLSSWMNVTKNNTNMGFLKIMGENQEEITVAKFSRSPEQVVMFGTGSMVYVLAQITPAVIGDDGLEQYPVGMWASLIIPTLVIPPEIDAIPGIEISETSIVKPDDQNGFTAESVEGW